MIPTASLHRASTDALILFLPVQSLLACFRASYARHVHSILFLSVQRLFACFRASPCAFYSVIVCAKSVRMFQSLAMCSSCLCNVCLIVSQALLLALRTLSVSFSDSEVLLCFTDSLAVHWAFLFDAKACPHPKTALFTWTSVLHRVHTFLRRKFAFTINRAKYQTFHSRETQKNTAQLQFRRQRATCCCA